MLCFIFSLKLISSLMNYVLLQSTSIPAILFLSVCPLFDCLYLGYTWFLLLSMVNSFVGTIFILDSFFGIINFRKVRDDRIGNQPLPTTSGIMGSQSLLQLRVQKEYCLVQMMVLLGLSQLTSWALNTIFGIRLISYLHNLQFRVF